MLESYFGIIEAIFVFSLAIAFYVWQMRDVKKEKARAAARERERERGARQLTDKARDEN